MKRYNILTLVLVPMALFVTIIAASRLSADAQTLQRVSESDSDCYYSTFDTYASAAFPDQNYGQEEEMQIFTGDAGGDETVMFVRFDISPIPNNAQIVNATLTMYKNSDTIGELTSFLRAVTENWGEATLTWNNLPSITGIYDSPTHSRFDGYKDWDASQLVNEWHTGVRTNYGLAISGGNVPEYHRFDTTEYSGSTTRRPQLCVEWSESGINTDIIVEDVEVTQGVQDLNNSVSLIAGKRTYVRVHARTTNDVHRTFAQLTLNNNGLQTTIYPRNENGSFANVRAVPNRNNLEHTFFFILPSAYTDGNLQLTAEVNPITNWRASRWPPESTYTNNSVSTSVSFDDVRPYDFIVYLADYSLDDNGTSVEYTTPITDAYALQDWIERAFPIPDSYMQVRRTDFGEVSLDPMNPNSLSSPTSGTFNARLEEKRKWDLDNDNYYEGFLHSAEKHVRYYGMITDEGGFMRGAGGGVRASGPTGDPARWNFSNWDNDNTYGDWYGGHELGHAAARGHVDCAGDEVGPDPNYPHTGGLISTATTGDDAFFGLDIRQQQVYGPAWSDIMSYCDDQWISDYTTHGIIDKLMEFEQPARTARTAVTTRTLVTGIIDGDTVTLRPIFTLPDRAEVVPRVPGAYAIVLRNGSTELARYPFTPEEIASGRDLDRSAPPIDLLLISEAVPYVAGTTSIDIEGPSGVLHTVSAGLTPPVVTVTFPNNGALFNDETVTINFFASDSDPSDDVVANVEFSPDNGTTWELVAQGAMGGSATIARSQLPETSDGLFRVWATDGIHSSNDVSNSVAQIGDHDWEPVINSPDDGAIFAQNQSVVMNALAFSPNAGTLGGDDLDWFSNRDGSLGSGATLIVEDLSVGIHNIVLFANDGTDFESAAVQIEIVDNPTLLETETHPLRVLPQEVVIPPGGSVELFVENALGIDPLAWSMFLKPDWLNVSATSGTTDDTLLLTVNSAELDPDGESGNVLFGSTDAPGFLPRVRVTARPEAVPTTVGLQDVSTTSALTHGLLVATLAFTCLTCMVIYYRRD